MNTAPSRTAPATIAQDPYALAQAATKLLAANPSDQQGLNFYARALQALNLQAALGSFTQKVAPTTGLIPWSSRARRFQANLNALAKRVSPDVVCAIQSAAASLPATHRLHQSADTNFHILNIQKPLPFAWLGGLANHKASLSLWQFDAAKTPIPAPLAFDGISHGHLFLHIMNTTERTFLNYSCPLYVLESNSLFLAIVLHLHDLQQTFASPRLRLFLKPDPSENLADFRSALTENQTWSIPQRFVRCSFEPRDPLPIEDIVIAVSTERQTRFAFRQSQIETYYAGKTPEFYRDRIEQAAAGKAPPLKILGITSRQTTVLKHSMAEMQSVINQTGTAEMRIAMEPDDQSLENPYVEMIASWKPDILFQISRLRHENTDLPRNIPFICWDQDNLSCMRTPQTTASLDAFTCIAGQGATYGYTFLNWPRENLIFCHAAGATHRYSAENIAQNVTHQYACDISFISNASEPPAQFRERLAERWCEEPVLASLFETTSGVILNRMNDGGSWEYHSLRKLIRETACQRGIVLTEHIEKELNLSLVSLSDRCFRHAALHWVYQWCRKTNRVFRLYGNGWDKQPDFAPFAAGYAAQGDQIMAIYKASKINLQLMESGGFLHSRTLDGLAAGAFFLNRTSPNDGANTAVVQAQSTLAARAAELGLVTKGDVENCSDPAVKTAWALMKPYFAEQPSGDRLTGLAIWNELPPARVIFPGLAGLSFASRAEFENLAEQYVSDERRRQDTAGEMREIVRREMSYSRRWIDFLAAVTKHLGRSSSPIPKAESPEILVGA